MPRSGLRLHHLLFITFTLIAAAPIAVLAYWASSTSFQNELESVSERHLLVARNLTSAMSRYVRDVKAAFGMAIDSGAPDHPVTGLNDLLTSLDVTDVRVLAPDGSMEAALPGLSRGVAGELSPALVAELRALAGGAHDAIAMSPLHRDATGTPLFYLIRQLPAGRLAVGILSTDYLTALQRSIAFGARGHAVLLDAGGQVIAHPLKEPDAAARDLAGAPVVAAMRRGETGVGQFHSAAFDDDMIAGYAVVPETGWGVMVPQPVSELQRRAAEVTQLATIIALLAFACSALMAWFLALYLARPVRSVADTAAAVLEGNDEVAAPAFNALVPREIRQMGAAFNTMLQALRQRAAETGKALREAEMSNAAKSQFLANMSHEIRTPLNGIVGMIELLQMTELTEAQRRHVETAAQSSQALLRLIDDILDLSRIEAGRLQLSIVPFHLPSLIQELRLLFAEQARGKGLTLLASVPPEMNLVLAGDKHRLQQILANLVGNAIKFTPDGTVSIRCMGEHAVGDAIRIRFEVSDTGIGVPASKQCVIFDAFTQADSSLTRRYGGTGLGLSIARQLVHMMDGDIGVRSTVGVGSTFWFTVVLERRPESALPAPLPVMPAEPAVKGPAVRGDVPGQPRAAFVSPAGREFKAMLERHGRDSVSILLVEDNPANMRVTQALLETLGCRVTIAQNGLEAVAAYRAESFDLVLMDCQMPEMDGYEATRTIRQLEAVQHRRTPILALTAHAMAGSRQAALDSGMDDQITKPLTMAILTRKLLQWLLPAESRAAS
ncbi:MAG TPA: response regulator [Rhodopila sp.]|nr:response regulator [Rhodopila sp.]